MKKQINVNVVRKILILMGWAVSVAISLHFGMLPQNNVKAVKKEQYSIPSLNNVKNAQSRNPLPSSIDVGDAVSLNFMKDNNVNHALNFNTITLLHKSASIVLKVPS